LDVGWVECFAAFAAMDRRRIEMSMRVSMKFAPLVLAIVGCSGAPEVEESTDQSSEAIVRGEIDDGHGAVMAINVSNLDGTETLCSATLYARQTLVTAAHCLDNAAFVLAYHGNDYWADFEQLFGDPAAWTNWSIGLDWQLHPKWDPNTVSADIAIVHLDRPTPVRPIPISFRDLNRHDIGERVEIIGYGAAGLDADGNPVDAYVKRSGRTRYLGIPSVRPLPPNPHPGLGIRKIREQLMELEGDAPKANGCFGDSGGPALVRSFGKQRLVGVGSWVGDDCEDFSYYVRVHDFLPFLLAGARSAP
jgi:hypothetical protein